MPPSRWDSVIFTTTLGSPHAAWHHPTPDHQLQCLLTQPDGTDLATSVGTEPPRCGTQGHVPGGAEQAASISQHAPFPACWALGHKDSDSPAQSDLPPLPGCSGCPSQCLLTPHQHYGVARQPELGPGAVPQPLQMEHGAGYVGRHVPSRRPRLRFRGGYVWSRTLRPGQHRRLPALAGVGTCVGRQGSQISALLGSGRRAVLGSPRPPASLPRGPGQPW